MKTKSEQIIEKGWGGALTHELVGKILCLADEANMWDEALKFISGVPDDKEVEEFIERMEQEINGNIICPMCGGDGKETCDNPDHNFINALSFHDIGRCGCPVCGHDENHKVPNGGDCEVCDGTGVITQSRFESYCDTCGYDDEPIIVNDINMS